MTIHTAVNGLAVLTGRFLQNAGVTAMLRSGFAAIRLATLAINSPRSVRILRATRPDVAEKINLQRRADRAVARSDLKYMQKLAGGG